MPRTKKHTTEQIIWRLLTTELELAKGHTAAQAVKKIAVTEQTYYRWRKGYGGLRTDQANRLKALEAGDVVLTGKVVPAVKMTGKEAQNLHRRRGLAWRTIHHSTLIADCKS
jgi:putative transposase